MTEPLKLMGHEFRPMTLLDYEIFGGADDGSFIWEHNEGSTVLIFNPGSGVLLELDADADVEKTWQFTGAR